MTTKDLENAAEILKAKAKDDRLQELNNRSQESSLWKPYHDALGPIKHRLCLENLEVYDSGVRWHKYPNDYALSIMVCCGVINYHYLYNGGDGFCGGSILTKEQFEYEITKLCAEHLKSEEEAAVWHKKNDPKPIVKPSFPEQEKISQEDVKIETGFDIIRDFIKFLFNRK